MSAAPLTFSTETSQNIQTTLTTSLKDSIGIKELIQMILSYLIQETFAATSLTLPNGTVSFIREQRGEVYFRVVAPNSFHSLLIVDIANQCAMRLLKVVLSEDMPGNLGFPGYAPCWNRGNIMARLGSTVYGIGADMMNEEYYGRALLSSWSIGNDTITYASTLPLVKSDGKAIERPQAVDVSAEQGTIMIGVEDGVCVVSSKSEIVGFYKTDIPFFTTQISETHFVSVGYHAVTFFSNTDPKTHSVKGTIYQCSIASNVLVTGFNTILRRIDLETHDSCSSILGPCDTIKSISCEGNLCWVLSQTTPSITTMAWNLLAWKTHCPTLRIHDLKQKTLPVITEFQPSIPLEGVFICNGNMLAIAGTSGPDINNERVTALYSAKVKK